jgi:hypothetical protein
MRQACVAAVMLMLLTDDRCVCGGGGVPASDTT